MGLSTKSSPDQIQSRVEYLACVHDALDEEDIFTHVIFFIQNAEFSKLGAPRCYVHVCPWPLKAVTVQRWLERLNYVLPVILICMEVITMIHDER